MRYLGTLQQVVNIAIAVWAAPPDVINWFSPVRSTRLIDTVKHLTCIRSSQGISMHMIVSCPSQ